MASKQNWTCLTFLNNCTLPKHLDGQISNIEQAEIYLSLYSGPLAQLGEQNETVNVLRTMIF